MDTPITEIPSAEQQHMLFLFMPVKKSMHAEAQHAVAQINSLVSQSEDSGQDLRALTGVHYFMFHLQLEGAKSGLPVPTFQNSPGKHLLIVQSIYDADFAPYIKSFVDNPKIAEKLDDVLRIMDETGIISPKDPTSAEFILHHGGVAKNPEAFNCLLMRYNFADPTIPAVVSVPAGPSPKYILGGTFPGLTVGKILQNYPDATSLWPSPPVPITYETSYAPEC